jgi:hypothetical protein
MVAELSRVNPASVASQRLSENLRPALQAVGEDQDWLSQYLVHTHNLDVAREMGQRAYDAAIAAGRTPAQASAVAMQAANTRTFSGDLNLADTQAALTAIENTVKGFPDGAQRWQALQDAAQSVWDHNKQTLERKRDAGLISDDLYTELTTRYPRYVRTDIADYFEKGAGGPAPAGRTIGTSDVGIQKLDPRGTGKDRVNPLLSTSTRPTRPSPRSSATRPARRSRSWSDSTRPGQSTFKEVVPAQGANVGNPATTVPPSYRLRGKEQFLSVWDGGQARTYVVPPEFAALVQPQGGKILGDNAAVNTWRAAMGIYKELITSKNPAFSMLVSPIRDAGDYAIREATRSAERRGPGAITDAIWALPGVAADYVKAIPAAVLRHPRRDVQGRPGRHDARGRRSDVAARSLGGRSPYRAPRTEQRRRRPDQERRRRGPLRRERPDAGGRPIGERLEQVPRLAAARREAARGGSAVDQAMAFRDATLDFQRGGDWAKAINTVVPFFNTAIQGGAQVARTARENPIAFVSAVAATVGSMTAASEAWNAADPSERRTTPTCPTTLKKTGIVFMLPGVEGTDQRNDRRPNFLWLPTGSYGAFVGAARDAIQKTAQGQGGPDLATLGGWGSLAGDVGGTFSPLRGDSAGAVLSSITPPGLSTGLELAANTDLYRGSTIATDRSDQQASALSQASASGFNAVTGQETRPSQWEYLYRDLGGYGANLALTGSNMAAEALGQRQPNQEDRPIQNAPVAGGGRRPDATAARSDAIAAGRGSAGSGRAPRARCPGCPAGISRRPMSAGRGRCTSRRSSRRTARRRGRARQ